MTDQRQRRVITIFEVAWLMAWFVVAATIALALEPNFGRGATVLCAAGLTTVAQIGLRIGLGWLSSDERARRR